MSGYPGFQAEGAVDRAMGRERDQNPHDADLARSARDEWDFGWCYADELLRLRVDEAAEMLLPDTGGGTPGTGDSREAEVAVVSVLAEPERIAAGLVCSRCRERQECSQIVSMFGVHFRVACCPHGHEPLLLTILEGPS